MMSEIDKKITKRTQATNGPMILGHIRKGNQNGQNLEEFSIETSVEEVILEVHSLELLRSFVL